MTTTQRPDPMGPDVELGPVDIVLMNLNSRIQSAQEDFLHHARWAMRDLERVIRDVEAGNNTEFHGESNIRKMSEAGQAVRLLAESRNAVLWAVERS